MRVESRVSGAVLVFAGDPKELMTRNYVKARRTTTESRVSVMASRNRLALQPQMWYTSS